MAILFQSDLSKFPSAIIDTETKNESWVRMAALLKSMGVRNHYFHLVLLQPQLQGIDVHSPTLTIEQKSMIAIEVRFNPWYFFREVARIPSGSTTMQFKLNRPNLSLIWSFLCGIDFVLLMPRQIGKSVTADWIEIWLVNYYYENTEMLIFTKDAGLRTSNINRIKNAMGTLPDWLNPQTNKDANNSENITCLARANKIKCDIGQPTAKAAYNIGRGGTFPYARIDEGPFIINIHKSLPEILAATGTARENFEAQDVLYGNIYITTAGPLDTEEGSYMYNFINSGMPWTEKLYDCKDKYEARDTVRTNSSKNRRLITGIYSHRQAGKTDAWLLERMSLSDEPIHITEANYLNKWFSGNSESALPTSILNMITQVERDPDYLEITKDRYAVRWYIPQHEIHKRLSSGYYGLGLDSSNAVGRDANGLMLTDFRDMSIVAACNISEANLHKYAIWIADLLIAYPRLTFIVENKSSAQGIIDTVCTKLIAAGIDPFKRIYNKVVDNHKTRQKDYEEINKPTAYRNPDLFLKYKGDFGFQTTGSSRQFLFNTVLNDAVKTTAHLMFDKVLGSELKGLMIKNGRVDHPDGGHDDVVVGLLLCHWFIKHSKNLQHYGINPLEVLTLVSQDGSTLTEEDLEKRNKVATLNEEITHLKEQLMQSPSLTDTMRYERLIIYKVSQANALGDIGLNIDAIMSEIDSQRKTKNTLRQSIQSHRSKNIGLQGLYRQ